MVLLNEINGIVSGNWRFCGVKAVFTASKSDSKGYLRSYMKVWKLLHNSVSTGNCCGQENSAPVFWRTGCAN